MLCHFAMSVLPLNIVNVGGLDDDVACIMVVRSIELVEVVFIGGDANEGSYVVQ